MDVNDTAYNEYVLCLDCEHSQGCFVSSDKEFECPQWSDKVKNVGICKYYKRCNNESSKD